MGEGKEVDFGEAQWKDLDAENMGKMKKAAERSDEKLTIEPLPGGPANTLWLYGE